MENSENTVGPRQRLFWCLRECLSQRRIELGLPTAAVIASSGYFGRVAEWQTRWLQVPVSFGTWGFKSPFAHRYEFTRSERRPEAGVRNRGRYTAADRPVPIEDRCDTGGHSGMAVVSQRGEPNDAVLLC